MQVSLGRVGAVLATLRRSNTRGITWRPPAL